MTLESNICGVTGVAFATSSSIYLKQGVSRGQGMHVSVYHTRGYCKVITVIVKSCVFFWHGFSLRLVVVLAIFWWEIVTKGMTWPRFCSGMSASILPSGFSVSLGSQVSETHRHTAAPSSGPLPACSCCIHCSLPSLLKSACSFNCLDAYLARLSLLQLQGDPKQVLQSPPGSAVDLLWVAFPLAGLLWGRHHPTPQTSLQVHLPLLSTTSLPTPSPASHPIKLHLQN